MVGRSEIVMRCTSKLNNGADIAKLSLDHGTTTGPMPAPNIDTKGIVAVDITDKFFQACQGKSSASPSVVISAGFRD